MSNKADPRVTRCARTLLTGTVEARCAAAQELSDMIGLEVVDIRAAQPALVVAMTHPEARLRLRATQVTRQRADEGCDIRLAYPILFRLVSDADPAVRCAAWEAVSFGDDRHRACQRPFAARASEALKDAQPEVVSAVERLLKKLG